ncbi:MULTISPECIES: aspartate 1-decarboxylase [Fervidobacterium]|uniref:Aspartate 1-decarboxylase n=1 Tax=Fervidobacterium nodosum (strain ATCC 35602 / DSM 5306 / Rt17-B1) TaxID=381764 RepID=PAND_FERNB|nr:MULTISPECIES: aspartate 1-decarboxylase [Fervidobacterium]A7HLE9.1 RecName: Full=Aspartate 1-decarboxylase; AltName: Full=Aspartate alpha-decarboxylase; Contains: RecName: Full=Aspartate 1-decarboxylase beta chain; Contains: RecName: Full=Aspartate 1-decarboxylase alpha chain; Flags: Precursor [Fervidobacterium nodosum Rt17-B1]ABS60732.1 aspartate 1-decarboxylase [Fervidobacterium nodosum Rt17-B1]KAF2960906.1 aspartate decarboxylase [Fervidobacterium sp. 2310opik-2]PHJ14191.1 aspartate decar
MMEIMLKAKIHMATVTEKEIEYEGSIGIDEELLELSGIKINEMVLISDVNNGNRFITYVIPEPRGSRKISLNGAAARLVEKGDKIIIMAFGLYSKDEYKSPKILIMNSDNTVKEIR